MTATQAVRMERRRLERERIERAHQTVKQAIVIVFACLLIAALMGLAEGGISDAELEAREVSYWAGQGIQIHRW